MSSRSVQPLFSYTDEFLRSEWVQWSEEFLFEKPADDFHNPRGFQQLTGAQSSDVRSRAREAYRMGLLRAPLIAPRNQPNVIPGAWQHVIAGERPHTILGLYAYIVGKIIQAKPSNEDAELALDNVANIQMLHIGFDHDGRWYTTALVFEFAKGELQKLVDRELTNRELRYLSAAVFNTLESTRGSELLQPYRELTSLKFLYFDTVDRGLTQFALDDLVSITNDSKIGLDRIKRKKASLFWSQQIRGIYSRAMRSESSSKFIATLTEVDRILCQQNRSNLLSEVYECIENNRRTVEIFQHAENKFSNYEILLERWHLLIYELDDIANSALETLDVNSSSKFLKFALAKIQSHRPGSTEQVVDLLGNRSKFTNISDAFAMQVQQTPDERYAENKFSQYIDGKFESIMVQMPAGLEPRNETNKLLLGRSRWDYESANAERRLLGNSGEHFVYLFERNRLKRVGRQDLANRVLWVSKELGDGFGYDILSFDDDGNHIFIEVKSTTKGKLANFFLSANELEVSKEKPTQYRIYRVFDLAKKPKIFVIHAPLERFVTLTPTQFRATII